MSTIIIIVVVVEIRNAAAATEEGERRGVLRIGGQKKERKASVAAMASSLNVLHMNDFGPQNLYLRKRQLIPLYDEIRTLFGG